jgi:hypothetical protein
MSHGELSVYGKDITEMDISFKPAESQCIPAGFSESQGGRSTAAAPGSATVPSVTHGALAGKSAWSLEEDDQVRASYTDGGITAAMAALPHRSRKAIFSRAQRLGISRQAHWTTEEDARLRNLWDEYPIEEIGSRLGRTAPAVRWRAAKLALPFGRQRGWEYLADAAKRTGFRESQLRLILRSAKISLRPILTNPKKRLTRRKCNLVCPLEVDEAVAEWIAREPVATAARRIGIHPDTLRIRLRRVGLEPPRPPGRPKKRESIRWRVTEEEVAKAMDGYVYYPKSAHGGATRDAHGRWAEARVESTETRRAA